MKHTWHNLDGKTPLRPMLHSNVIIKFTYEGKTQYAAAHYTTTEFGDMILAQFEPIIGTALYAIGTKRKWAYPANQASVIRDVDELNAESARVASSESE